MTLEEYIKKELDKPSTNPHYDPNGNSSHAVMTRGKFGEIIWQYKDYPSYLKWVLGEFKGLRTSIDWIISVPILIAFSPVIPVIWGISRYRRAFREYESDYEAFKKEVTNEKIC